MDKHTIDSTGKYSLSLKSVLVHKCYVNQGIN